MSKKASQAASAESSPSTPLDPGAAATFVDPVCGVRTEATGGNQTEHRGTTYAFCCDVCLAKFLLEPERYTVEPRDDGERVGARGATRPADFERNNPFLRCQIMRPELSH